MRTAFSILVGLLAIALLGGCGGDGATATAQGPRGIELTFHRTGGIAGVDEKLRIHRSGAASLTEGRAPALVTMRRFEVGPAQAKRLKRGLARAHSAHLEVEGVPKCADCFLYRLRTPANSVLFEGAGAPNQIKPVIARLEAIVAAHRRGGRSAHRPFHSGSRFSKKAFTPSTASSVESSIVSWARR